MATAVAGPSLDTTDPAEASNGISGVDENKVAQRATCESERRDDGCARAGDGATQQQTDEAAAATVAAPAAAAAAAAGVAAPAGPICSAQQQEQQQQQQQQQHGKRARAQHLRTHHAIDEPEDSDGVGVGSGQHGDRSSTEGLLQAAVRDKPKAGSSNATPAASKRVGATPS